jgi:sugar lactone lactonase YvrE
VNTLRVVGLTLGLSWLGACSPLLPNVENTVKSAAYSADLTRPPGHEVLFVGSAFPRISQYAVGSAKPLRSVKAPDGAVSLALDSAGELFAANGNPSYGAISVYSAHSLQLIRTFESAAPQSLAVDENGYLYVANCGDGIDVYAPGGERYAGEIRRGVDGACTLGFGPDQRLYVVNSGSIGIYRQTGSPGKLRFVKNLRQELKAPRSLTFDANGDLYVGSCPSCNHNGAKDFVTIYETKHLKPLTKILAGIESPDLMAVDSTRTLYVANHKPYKYAWISAYAKGATRPKFKVTRGINGPESIVVDAGDYLYVANTYGNCVTVYDPRGRLVRTVTKGLHDPTALLVSHAWK